MEFVPGTCGTPSSHTAFSEVWCRLRALSVTVRGAFLSFLSSIWLCVGPAVLLALSDIDAVPVTSTRSSGDTPIHPDNIGGWVFYPPTYMFWAPNGSGPIYFR